MIFCNHFCGQLGNHLLTMINLIQIMEFVHVPLIYDSIFMKYFFDIYTKKYIEYGRNTSKLTIHSRYLVNIYGSKHNISKEMLRKIATHTDIHIKQPCLGELFFRYAHVHPNQYIKIKPQYSVKPRSGNSTTNKNIITVGIHIRDMGSWNKRHEGASDLKPSYYINAIDYCIQQKDELGGELLFILMGATSNKQSSIGEQCDVSQYPPYVKTEEYIKKNNISYEYCITTKKPRLNFIYDWDQLSQCDVIISSAGTFAISAGILGKPNKKIIHCKEWVEYAAQKHDTFWEDLYKTNGNRYYQLWKLI